MKITLQQRVDYLESILGDGDLEMYEAWVLWCEKTNPENLPTYLEFKRIHNRLDRQWLKEYSGLDYAEWFKNWTGELE